MVLFKCEVNMLLTYDQKEVLKTAESIEQFGHRWGYTDFEVTFDGDFVYISYDDQDGPAIEWPDGTKRQYLNGKELTEQEFNEKMESKSKSKSEIIDEIARLLKLL